ncbi:MAG: glycine cleavage system protein T, partial [Thermoguttaceae bacterium]|nr:glycine cleavage system protein T [Thermoguttaceae bacterium]
NGEKVGVVTTGVPAPTLGKNLALALLPPQYAEPETQVEIMVRNKPIRALVKKGIFYRKKTLAR